MYNSADVLEINVRSDGNGELRMAFPMSAGIIDHIAVVADPALSPDSAWDVQLNEVGDADILRGLLLNLSSSVKQVYYPYIETASGTTYEKVSLRQDLELYCSGMGADKAATLVFFVRK